MLLCSYCILLKQGSNLNRLRTVQMLAYSTVNLLEDVLFNKKCDLLDENVEIYTDIASHNGYTLFFSFICSIWVNDIYNLLT